MDQPNLIVDIGIEVIRRTGGDGAFKVDEGTILMIWSGENITANSDTSYLDGAVFDDSLNVMYQPLSWADFVTE